MGSSARITVAFLIAVAAIASSGGTARAIYLDESRNISLRARVYTQAAVRISDSGQDTVPEVDPGDLVQHRTFYNPELDANLTPYSNWLKRLGPLSLLAPSEFGFRIAAWGFYDGVYDYGAEQFNRQQRRLNRSYPIPDQTSAFFLEGDDFRCLPGDRGGSLNECILRDDNGQPVGVEEYYPGAEKIRPRDIYAHRQRVNELYLNYTKGPLFIRLGRQAISWGEADTIGILDQNNPFDVTRGAPGAFVDLDEARIPLWTIRTTFDLLQPFNVEAIGPFSSISLEAYWVPGFIDTNTGILPVLTASPYSPRGRDPQTLITELGIPVPVQFVLFDHVPDKKMSNSRYGFRVQSVIARDHTFSLWFYTHFPNQPVPRAQGLARTYIDANGDSTAQQSEVVRLFTTETVHQLTSVYGIADSFFVEAIDSIIRAEVEYFENEPGFVPERNLGAAPDPNNANPLGLLTTVGSVPTADFLRWELGLDRFFFIRPLNPTNSFTLATAMVGSYNMDETPRQDFRYAGLRKPGGRGELADHFVQLKKVEVFGQMRLQTSYMHGRVEPGVTLIANARGTHAVLPDINFRVNDWLHLGVRAVYIGGEFQQLGFYKDRDEISARLTYLLN